MSGATVRAESHGRSNATGEKKKNAWPARRRPAGTAEPARLPQKNPAFRPCPFGCSGCWAGRGGARRRHGQGCRNCATSGEQRAGGHSPSILQASPADWEPYPAREEPTDRLCPAYLPSPSLRPPRLGQLGFASTTTTIIIISPSILPSLPRSILTIPLVSH